MYTLRDYVRTDAETLKAFVIVVAARDETSLTVEIPDFSIKTVDATGRVAVHVMQPAPRQINNQLRKAEVGHTVQGFLPFYRQTLRTIADVELDHPSNKPFDVGRGARSGYVLVGLHSNPTRHA